MKTPVNKGTSDIRKKIGNYSKLAAATIAAAINNISDGQIIYTDINPDITIASGSYNLDLDNNGISDFRISQKYGTITFQTGSYPSSYTSTTAPAVYLKTLANNEVLACNFDFPFASKKFQYPNFAHQDWKNGDKLVMAVKTDNYYIGRWIGITDRYLNLRIKINNEWHYGWARLDVSAFASYFKIKDYAYKTTPDDTISPGETSISGINEHNPLKDISVYSYDKTLFIKMDAKTGKAGLILCNLIGQEIKSLTINPPETEIPLNDINPGIYIVHIQNEYGIISRKISIR